MGAIQMRQQVKTSPPVPVQAALQILEWKQDIQVQDKDGAVIVTTDTNVATGTDSKAVKNWQKAGNKAAQLATATKIWVDLDCELRKTWLDDAQTKEKKLPKRGDIVNCCEDKPLPEPKPYAGDWILVKQKDRKMCKIMWYPEYYQH